MANNSEFTTDKQGLLDQVVYAKIHPSIGVARVGNSKEIDGFYLGPQVVNPVAQPASSYRDSSGALKREVAEFRVYGYDGQGRVVCELTMDGATDICWTVELANQKAAWYNFDMALDIPDANNIPPSKRRNSKIEDRESLIIQPGPRSIAAPATQGMDYAFSGGSCFSIPVSLGEIRTDAHGRLHVFGGHGQSASVHGKPPTTFANNDGWYDDTSDGPVTAQLKIQGREIAVEPAWVIVAPPNYAPQIKGVRTLYALLTDVAIQAGQLPAPTTASFQNDILPIFTALCDHQWVNKGFAAGFGYGMPQHFLEPTYLAKLADPDPTYTELRRTVANAFRSPAQGDVSMKPWPWIYGDAMDVPSPPTPAAMNALTPTQLYLLELWASGRFLPDWQPELQPPAAIEAVPLQEQPSMLDRAALEFCLADAFHPGCEVTWPVRHATMYQAPYRWRHRAKNDPEPDLGSSLSPSNVATYNGPLFGQSPGSITRWMAVPWQTDTASCRSGYERTYDPYLPTFWPARVPNQVLSEENYQKAIDASLPRSTRLAAFQTRDDWDATLGTIYKKQLEAMVTAFDQQGVVLVRPGVSDDPDLPPTMQVADRSAGPLSTEEREGLDQAMRLMARRPSNPQD